MSECNKCKAWLNDKVMFEEGHSLLCCHCPQGLRVYFGYRIKNEEVKLSKEFQDVIYSRK